MALTHSHISDNEEEEEVVQRFITFWRNGFSIEGGEFYSYADPENERLLAEINTGYDTCFSCRIYSDGFVVVRRCRC